MASKSAFLGLDRRRIRGGFWNNHIVVAKSFFMPLSEVAVHLHVGEIFIW